MTLVKSADVGLRVRSFVTAAEVTPPAWVAEVAQLEAQIGQLRQQLDACKAELAARDERLARAELEQAQARQEGESLGRAEGVEEGLRRATAAGAAIQKAATEGRAAADETWSAFERLAVGLTEAALAKLFGPESPAAPSVVASLKRSLAELEGQQVLSVRCSMADFPDETALAELQHVVGRADVHLYADPALASGACLLRLELGGLDLSLDRQWGRLRDLLDRLRAGADGDG